MPSDYEIILAVNELARTYVNADPERLATLPEGARCDMNRWRFVRQHFERAAKEYYQKTGYDVRVALANHERFLRNRDNAPQLHIDRRA